MSKLRGIKTDIGSDVENRHPLFEYFLNQSCFIALVLAEGECARDNGISGIEHDRNRPISNCSRDNCPNDSISCQLKRFRLQQNRIDELRDGHGIKCIAKAFEPFAPFCSSLYASIIDGKGVFPLSDSLENEIRTLISNVGGLAPNFDAQADLYSDLGMASVKAMQLLMELEDRFGVSIPDEDFVQATTLSSVHGLISRLLPGSPA